MQLESKDKVFCQPQAQGYIFGVNLRYWGLILTKKWGAIDHHHCLNSLCLNFELGIHQTLLFSMTPLMAISHADTITGVPRVPESQLFLVFRSSE
jgi:hypothetical protein